MRHQIAILILASLHLTGVTTSHAATFEITGPVELAENGDCTPSSPTRFILTGEVTGTIYDLNDSDLFAVYLVDGSNIVIDVATVMLAVDVTTNINKFSLGIKSATPSRPFKFLIQESTTQNEWYVTGDIPVESILHQHTVEFDPAELDPDCAIYPLAGETEAETSASLTSYLETRASLILDRDMGTDRRIDRLNGISSVAEEPGAAIFSYAAGLTDGSVPVAGSLAAFDALAGNEQRRFDIWFDSTFALFERAGTDGLFSTGTVGADYLLTDDLLIGAFLSVDHLTQSATPFADEISGLGWLAGPYATLQLGDNLYLDILAGAGTASNSVDKGTGTPDTFDSSRWLVNASLQGTWGNDSWRFAPRLGFGYFEETSEGYTEGDGFEIAPVTVGMGRIAAGPGITHTTTGEDGTRRDISVRLDAVQLFTSQSSSLSARAEAGIDWQTSNGLSFGASTSYSGLGSADHSIGASVKASAGF
jgi:hypothetical protein